MPKLTCPHCQNVYGISVHRLSVLAGHPVNCPVCQALLRVPSAPPKVYEARPFRFGFGLGAGCLGGSLLALTVFWLLLYAGCAAVYYGTPTPPEFQQWKSLEKGP